MSVLATPPASASASLSAPPAASAASLARLLHRALPVQQSEAGPTVEAVESWHRSVLPSHASSVVRRDVLFVSAVGAFVSLLFVMDRCAGRWRRDTHFGRLWAAWSRLQRLEWLSYAVSTVHAVLASIAACVVLPHSLQLLYSQSHSPSEPAGEERWAAVSWFLRTSFHRPLSVLHASHVTASLVSASSAFDLALSCAFSESIVRDCSLLVTAAYLLVDLVLCIASAVLSRHQQQQQQQSAATNSRRVLLASPLTLLHHSLILLAFGWGVWTQTGTLYMVGLLLNELSTPFLNLNWHLAASQLSVVYPRLYVCNAAVLLLVFVAARLLLNAALLCHIFLFSWTELQPLWRAGSPWLMPAAVRVRCAALSGLCCVHVALQAVWAVQLVRAVQRKWSKAVRRRAVSSNGGDSKHKQL